MESGGYPPLNNFRRRLFLLLLSAVFVGCTFQFCQRGYAEPSLDVVRFRYAVERRVVSRTKNLHRDGVGKRTVVRFAVLRDGSLKDLRVYEKSGSLEHDALAIATVKACAPFPNIPADGPAAEE